MAKEILLQIDYLKINRYRKHWNIYFILATSDPTNVDKMMITTLPDGDNAPTIALRHSSNNEIHFRPEGVEGGDGLFVLKHAMPTDYNAKARLWVMHSRKSLKSVGTILTDISNFMGQVDGIVSNIGVAMTQPWLIAEKAANKGIGGVGAAIDQLPNTRNLGFVNLDEHFGHEFDKTGERDASNRLSTAYAEVGWTWEVLEAIA